MDIHIYIDGYIDIQMDKQTNKQINGSITDLWLFRLLPKILNGQNSQNLKNGGGSKMVKS